VFSLWMASIRNWSAQAKRRGP